MNEGEVPVCDILIWLSRMTPETAHRLIVGCSLDDGKAEEIVPIVAIDWERRAITLDTDLRVQLRAVPDGLIVDPRPGAPLARALAESRTPEEIRQREVGHELRQAGLPPEKFRSDNDRNAVSGYLGQVNLGNMPDQEQRTVFYHAIAATGDTGLARVGARKLSEVIERFGQLGQRLPDDVYWQCAVLLRIAGQIRDAVDVSRVLFQKGVVEDRGAGKVLATTRTASLLDLYEMRDEPGLLDEAEKSLKIAYALGPDDEEVKNLYRRRDALRRRREERPSH